MNLNWYELDRQELPHILIGDRKVSGKSMRTPLSPEYAAVIGTNSTDENTLVAITLVGKGRGELFSWLSTYAEEIFPLSQFCRVCSTEDWKELNLSNYNLSEHGSGHPIWASLILGEILGQADSDLDVAEVPLGRATACFSFAMARAATLYPRQSIVMKKCIERMQFIENEPRFARKQISVETLIKVWNAALFLQKEGSAYLGAVEVILRVVGSVNIRASNFLRENKDLLSDSAENRIVGFDNVVDMFFEMRNADEVSRDGGAIALAAAALLVGRGTSHIQLLAPAAKLFPEALVWYGLLAGVMGSRHWDLAWVRKTKGIEKFLRQYFSPNEPAMADLCWPEYEWISRTYDSAESFNFIPKSAPRSLAIEILPGVSCQFRLAGITHPISTENISSYTNEPKHELSITEETLEHVKALLGHVQDLLSSPKKQEDFFNKQGEQKRTTKRKISNKSKLKE